MPAFATSVHADRSPDANTPDAAKASNATVTAPTTSERNGVGRIGRASVPERSWALREHRAVRSPPRDAFPPPAGAFRTGTVRRRDGLRGVHANKRSELPIGVGAGGRDERATGRAERSGARRSGAQQEQARELRAQREPPVRQLLRSVPERERRNDRPDPRR